jgi:hypothetical protein
VAVGQAVQFLLGFFNGLVVGFKIFEQLNGCFALGGILGYPNEFSGFPDNLFVVFVVPFYQAGKHYRPAHGQGPARPPRNARLSASHSSE